MVVNGVSRRQALALGIGCTVAAGSGTRSGGTESRPGANGKFDPDGRFRRWPGNTIICFARTEPDLWQALMAMREAARTEPLMRAFTLLPASGLHMTLLTGLNSDHRHPPLWPASLDIHASIPEANAWCRQRLTGFATGGGRFRMRVDDTVRAGAVKAFDVRLSPGDAATAGRLRDVRARLCDRLEIDPPNRDAYAFHITLGYLVASLTSKENAEIARSSGAWLRRLATTVPEFTIGPPVLCGFEDMASFTPMLTLAD